MFQRIFIHEKLDIDIIIPVPIHWTKLIFRKYNQAALLASDISKLLKIPSNCILLKKQRHTLSQSTLSAQKRSKNLKNAFYVDKTKTNLIKNKNILLIDDVMTTGATVRECSKVLIKSGCATVYVATIARVKLTQ